MGSNNNSQLQILKPLWSFVSSHKHDQNQSERQPISAHETSSSKTLLERNCTEHRRATFKESHVKTKREKQREQRHVEPDNDDKVLEDRIVVRSKEVQTSNLNNPAVAAGIALTGLYWGIRATLKVFHSNRRRMLRDLLFDLCNVLNRGGDTYWLDFGSLLGVYRDGDLILHDNDIDLAVLNPDWTKLYNFLQQHLGHKYSVRYVTPSEDEGTTFLRVYCMLGMADIFGAVQEGGKDSDNVHIQLGHGDCCDIQQSYVLPTTTMKFRDCVISIPAQVECTLKHRYGVTWNVPRYMDKGADVVEQQKLYARLFSMLGRLGIRI